MDGGNSMQFENENEDNTFLRRKSTKVSKEEILLILRAYQQHPSNWNEIIDEVKGNTTVLSVEQQRLYRSATKKQLKDRISHKFGKITHTHPDNIEDPDIRKEALKIRRHERQLIPDTVPKVLPTRDKQLNHNSEQNLNPVSNSHQMNIHPYTSTRTPGTCSMPLASAAASMCLNPFNGHRQPITAGNNAEHSHRPVVISSSSRQCVRPLSAPQKATATPSIPAQVQPQRNEQRGHPTQIQRQVCDSGRDSAHAPRPVIDSSPRLRPVRHTQDRVPDHRQDMLQNLSSESDNDNPGPAQQQQPGPLRNRRERRQSLAELVRSNQMLYKRFMTKKVPKILAALQVSSDSSDDAYN